MSKKSKKSRRRKLQDTIKFISTHTLWNPKTKQFDKPRRKPSPKLVLQSGIAPKKAKFAAKMRANPTSLERILDTSLRLALGSRFIVYRQWVEAGYILDFYIHSLRLAFEADGPLHDAAYDARRDRHILKRGIRTVRFNVADLRHDLHGVHLTILREVEMALKTNK